MAITLSGSLILSGSIEATGGVTISGSIASASYAENASTASYVANAVSSSYSLNALTSSNAMTASSADTLYVRNNVTALGSITAQTLIVQTVTSSVLFSTGSNKLGSSLSNTQELTGSVGITGSLTVVTTGTEFQVNAGGVNIGNALTDNHVISGSVTINPNGLFVSSSGIVGVRTTSLVSDTLLPIQINAVATTGQAYFASNNNGSYGLLMGYDNANGYARIRNVSNTALTFETNNTEKVRITNAGIMGIGTNSPLFTSFSQLTIKSTTAGGITIQAGATDYSRLFFAKDDTSNTEGLLRYYHSDNSMQFFTAATERMRITSGGDVNVGATTFAGAGSATTGVSLGPSGALSAQRNAATVGFFGRGTNDGELFAFYRGTTQVGSINVTSSSISLTSLSNGGLTIASTGNIGIGASTAPVYRLEVSTSGGSERIRVGTLQNNNNTATFEAITSSTISTATSGWIRAVYGGGLALGTSTYTKAGGDSGNFANLSAEVLTVAMTINGGGVDLNNPTTIGKNSNAGSHIAFTENQIYRTGNGILYFQEYSTNHIIALNGGGNLLLGTSTNLGYKLFANGSAGGLSNWNNVSDGRLKKDITPVVNGLDKIKQLNGVYFNWDKTLRPDLNLDDNNHLGLIAQDVEAILPQVVTTGDDEFNTKTIAYSDIVPVLIEAIKELSTKNTSLEERLAILENAQ
jgi:hypothetical protein